MGTRPELSLFSFKRDVLGFCDDLSSFSLVVNLDFLDLLEFTLLLVSFPFRSSLGIYFNPN